jgi:integrase
VWWIQVYKGGKAHRESTRTRNKREAENILKIRLSEVQQNTFSPNANKLTVQQLFDAYIEVSKINELSSLADIEARWRIHLGPRFAYMKISQVTPTVHKKYINQRKEEGAENSTINRETSILQRCFRLALEEERINRVPYFQKLKESNIRRGFLENPDQMREECSKIGPWMQGLFEVGYGLGWRREEVVTLQVRQLDMFNRCVRLDDSKNGEGRLAYMTTELYNALLPLVVGKEMNDPVFTRNNGSAVRDFRRTWAKITEAAGVPGLMFHDLRRTAVRNMIRRGVPERVAMQISGHKTRSMFDRYNIVSDSDLRAAAAKLENSATSVQVISETRQSVVAPSKVN